MTVEQMNKKIALYMGYVAQKLGSKTWFEAPELGNPFTDQLKYHKSFDWLMPVWQKLRGELDDLAVDEYGMVKDSDYIVSKYAIEKSILSCDITTAHRLIVEAIQLIKK